MNFANIDIVDTISLSKNGKSDDHYYVAWNRKSGRIGIRKLDSENWICLDDWASSKEQALEIAAKHVAEI